MRHGWNKMRITRKLWNDRNSIDLLRTKHLQLRNLMFEQNNLCQLSHIIIMFIELIIICSIRNYNNLPKIMYMDYDLRKQTLHRISSKSYNRCSLCRSPSRMCHYRSWMRRYICPMHSLLRNWNHLCKFQRIKWDKSLHSIGNSNSCSLMHW